MRNLSRAIATECLYQWTCIRADGSVIRSRVQFLNPHRILTERIFDPYSVDPI
jgi:hypothetical protein